MSHDAWSVVESCSCGATFETSAPSTAEWHARVDKWRTNHRHEFQPPAPCCDHAEPPTDDGEAAR